MEEDTSGAVQDTGDAQNAAQGANQAQGAETPDPGRDGDTFPRAYVEELRRESAGYRTRAATAESRAEELARQAADAAERAQAEQTAARQRIEELTVQAAVMREATRLGFHDPDDAYRLLPHGAVGIEDGAASGVREALEKLAAEKPHLVQRHGVRDAAASGASGPVNDMNEMLRKAAGRG